jgi:Na+/proline symporter
VSEDVVGSLIGLIIGLCVGIPFLVVYLYSVFWAYNDAEKRGKSGCLVALLVFLLSWPVGLIIWLLIRPQEKYY